MELLLYVVITCASIYVLIIIWVIVKYEVKEFFRDVFED